MICGPRARRSAALGRRDLGGILQDVVNGDDAGVLALRRGPIRRAEFIARVGDL